MDRQRIGFPSLVAALVSVVMWCCGPLHAAAATDYLNPELRSKVDQLKADVIGSPTTAANAAERTRVLWDWANAFALNGGYVPVNLTAAIRPVNPDRVRPREVAALDGYIRELSLQDTDPKAIGALTADLGPFEARSWATFQQTYTVGTRPIVRGGGLVVGKHFMVDHGDLQTQDPAAPNYLSIASSSGTARFVVDSAPIAGMHGNFRGAANMLFFRLDAGTLQKGDTVTLTYGARSGGSPGLRMPSTSSDFTPFPLYLIFDDSGEQYSLPIQPIRISGTSIAGVHGFAPSVVRPDEAFTISVRAQDRFFNRAQPPYPDWQVYANDELLGALPAAGSAIALLENLRLNSPGVYRITIRSGDGAITGVANPILVSADAQKIQWGDTHGHSGFAEGIGTPDRFMTWARDDARLEFVTHSEHDIWMDDSEWEVLRDNVAKYSEEGRFIAYLGYEWTTSNIYGGHHNVLFRTPADRERVPTQWFPTLSDLYAGLRLGNDPQDVVVIPHAHQAGNYRMGDPKLQPLVEIMSQHGTFEWFGRMYLQHGQQVGFIAASDNHLSQPGYTAPKGGGLSQRGGLGAVLAPETSRDAIFDAMKELRVYATTGDRMILDVSLNDAGMGQRIPFVEKRRIKGRVIGTAPIESITLVRNDEEIWQKDYLSIESGAFAKEETFYLSFDSSSTPMHSGDNPRGWRPWSGRVEVIGADLVTAEPTDFFNADMQAFSTEAGNANAFVFETASRGDASSVRLVLKNIRRGARVKVNLVPTREFGSGPPIYRQLARLPGGDFELALADLERGVLSRTLPFDIYEDRITLRRRIPNGAEDVSFEIEDTGTIQGDYYFIRVKQVNDAMAWSSPIWVGGYPNR
ncbi:MAG: DUF3604 domain-containing protein [Pseudomonadales bacterium]